VANDGALAGLRILDLTGVRGALCGRMLADMGADVIKIEPPGGDPTRALGPFAGDLTHPDRSLKFWFYNLNKRSVVLDYGHARGAEMLLRLAESADVLIESFDPGFLDGLGLAWETLHRRNPALILCSLTPFGQDGPYRDFLADDTILSALGGMLYVNGFPDEPPLRPLGLQAYHFGSIMGASAIMCALFGRLREGRGQWIDLSIHEATVCGLEQVPGQWREFQVSEQRRGTQHWTGGFRAVRCSDGRYLLNCTLGDFNTLLEWLKSEDAAQDLVEPQWQDPLYRRAHAAHMFDVIDAWIKHHTAHETLEQAQLLRLAFSVVRSTEELLGDQQLAARGYFVAVEHPELGRQFLYPGAPYQFSATPWRLYRRPPLLGEHTREVLTEELGIGGEELEILHAEGVC
jgi:crotonobetainyl-CoA:carnitine CoA-transferase CaiB-like acyl-CoA transferase